MTDAAPAPPHKTNALFNTNKLGLFSLNADGGITITGVPERWRADWSDIVDVAKMVDRPASSSFCRSRAVARQFQG